jgi:hypothetical protein
MLNAYLRSSRSASIGALLLPTLLAFAACGGGGEGPSGTAGTPGGAAGSVGSAGAGSGTAGAGSGSAGSGSAGAGTAGMTGAAGMGAGVAACESYCTAITANCTGANAQYTDKANCLKVCSRLPQGTTPTENTGNSVYCRTNSAKAATMDTKAVKQECFAAGPFGFGTCGSECDILCPVIISYCSAAEGYTGAAPFTSLDSCMEACGVGWGHQVDPTMPGIYSANYTPGPTDDLKDTSDCRAYQLFIKAMGSAAGAQAASCPNTANNSPTCGPGYIPPVLPDGGTGNSDGPAPVFEGGTVNIINSTNWNETKYPYASRKMLLRDEGDPHLVMIDLSKTPIQQWKTVAGGPWARAAQLIGNNQILGGRNDGYEVFDYTTGAIVKTVKNFGGTQSAYRLASGETMLTTSGTVLKFLDKNDAVARQISYPGYGYVRVARPTRKGTFLVPSDNTVFEGDATGKVLWKLSGGAPGWGHIWEPLMMGPPVGAGAKWKDGDYMLCTAFGSSCDVIDGTTHMVTYRFGGKAMANAAAVRPNFFSEFEILPNGHIFCSNWQGHGAGNGANGIQVLEFDQTGTVVWFWKQDPTIFSSIQGVQVMDGKDPKYLHVQETSTNSTWQPVMP